MKKYKVLKNGIETNSWLESPEMGADYWEPCFGAKAYLKEEKDDDGEVISSELIPAEYEVVEEEFDPEAGKAKSDALAYLAATDWYVVRWAETGVEVPNDIFEARTQARVIA